MAELSFLTSLFETNDFIARLWLICIMLIYCGAHFIYRVAINLPLLCTLFGLRLGCQLKESGYRLKNGQINLKL